VLKLPVYLDNHATTRTDPRVVAAMLPYFTEAYGNASSAGHQFGWEAADALENARARVSALIGAEPREIVFTSGATEANNLALKGVVTSLKRRGNHLVTAVTEHRAVLDPLRRLAREGYELTVVAADPDGTVQADTVAAALTERTVLVSIMAANNEVGTINPLAEIGHLCRTRGVVFHTDATQAVGKVPLDVREIGADLLSLSGHKFHGPKGIGALYVSRSGPPFRLSALFDGGGQERGLRSGTVAVPLAVGLGAAAEIAGSERDAESARVAALRGRLHELLSEKLDGLRWNGDPTRRLPGNLHVSVKGVDGQALLMALKDVAVSSGSACSTAEAGPSHVLLALGVDEALARASLRFGLGRFTTEEEVDFAAGYVADIVRRLRARAAVG
jgi:cysteine desulfurase